MKQQKQHMITMVLLCFTLLMLSTGCSSFIWQTYKTSPPLPSAENPPIYPDAQNITINHDAVEFGERITFETRDEPDKVLEYYKNLLIKEGWTFVPAESSATELYFKYGLGPFYYFYIQTQKTPAGPTIVTLTPRTIPTIH